AGRGTDVEVGSGIVVLGPLIDLTYTETPTLPNPHPSLLINNAATVTLGLTDRGVGKTRVAISSLNVQTTLILDARNAGQSTFFNVAGSSIDCTRFSVAYRASEIQQLVVLGGRGGTAVHLGDIDAALDALPTDITVAGGGGTSTLLVNG